MNQNCSEIGIPSNNESLKSLILSYEVQNKDELYSGNRYRKNQYLTILRKELRKAPAKNVIKYWELKLIGSKKEKKEAETSPGKY